MQGESGPEAVPEPDPVTAIVDVVELRSLGNGNGNDNGLGLGSSHILLAMSWMASEIRERGGAISFRDYMELALYHPTHGYYAAARPRYGRSGDFLTAPTASPWYGAVLARLLRAVAVDCGAPLLVDAGSGDGSLIANLLEEYGTDRTLRGVVSVERSPAMRELQVERFRETACPVPAVEDLAGTDLGDGVVVVHASELYDALPVQRVVGRADGLQELWVREEAGALSWEERAAPAALREYLAGHQVELVPGQLAEVNLEARELHRGFLERCGEEAVSLVVDYGYEARRLYDSRGRFGGSLCCFRQHHASRDPLIDAGEQDITAHLNWDDLRRAASDVGWAEVGLWPLAELLVRGGLADELASRALGPEAELDAATFAARQEVKRLLDPDGMGSDLKVLVQGRGQVLEVVREHFTLGV